VTTDEVVTDPQRAGLHQHRGDRPATTLEVGIYDRADRVPLRVGLQLEDVGGQDDRGEEVVDALAGLGAEVDAFVLASVVAGHYALGGELLVHAVRVGAVLVHLVDGDDDRHLRRSRMVDGLDCLRLDTVISRDHEDHDVGDLRASCAHRSERFVAGGVDENDRMTVGRLDLVGADALRDAARFAGGDSRLADRVKDRRLAMVDVAEDCDDWRAGDELGRILVGEREELLAGRCHNVALTFCRLDRDHVFARHRLHGEAELVGDDLRRGEVDDLVDRRQDLRGHQLLDHLNRAHAELLGQVLHRERRRQDRAAVAVGLDLDCDGGGLERRPGGLDGSGGQGCGGVAGQPALLEEVHQLLLTDPKFAREFVCLHPELSIMPFGRNSKRGGRSPLPFGEQSNSLPGRAWRAGSGRGA
jgi:hypothetical protein